MTLLGSESAVAVTALVFALAHAPVLLFMAGLTTATLGLVLVALKALVH